MPSATVPTAKEMKAAFTGDPTAVTSLALVGPCKAVAAPAISKVRKTRMGT